MSHGPVYHSTFKVWFSMLHRVVSRLYIGYSVVDYIM